MNPKKREKKEKPTEFNTLLHLLIFKTSIAFKSANPGYMFPLLCVQVCVGPGVKLESGTVLVARQQDDDDFGDEITDRPDGQPLGRHHMSITYSLGVDLEQDVDKISTFREYA